MSDASGLSIGAIEVKEKLPPTWWVVYLRELNDLWISGKAFNLIIIYSLPLGLMIYLYSFNAELRLIPTREAVYEMLRNALAIATFVGLIIGADSLSGERDRATLESLLLTPANRRQIIVGKFLAACSIWPAAYVITIPYLYVLAQGDGVFVSALIWGILIGTVLAAGFTATGMLVSFLSSTSKISYPIALGIDAGLLISAELPGESVGMAGKFLQLINPMAATDEFLSEHLVNHGDVAELSAFLVSSAVLAVLSTAVLLLISPGLRLETGRRNRSVLRIKRAVGLAVVASLIVVLLLQTAPANASQSEPEHPLTISLDLQHKQVMTGETVEFSALVTNRGKEASLPLIVAMNIINLDPAGEVADPEDWSPERTQYTDSLEPGESVDLEWIIYTILEGEYLVYIVVFSEPDYAEGISFPVASPGIPLTVASHARLSHGGALPLAVGGPIALLVISYSVYSRRRQQIDRGSSSS